jgi:2-C-methyl-D-erythritol 4-phosphate cytidylyltransferase
VIGQATDDCALVEGMGGTVRLVECPRDNLKVTTPEDLQLADLLLRTRHPH